jgi:hypothetical protein
VNLGKDTPLSAPIITRYRDRNSNLRTQLERIIRKADLKPWPKLFQNLRATRETELAEEFPIHVVCDWIGNTQAVATKHYLQTTDEHFARATEKAQQSASEGGRFGRKGQEGQRENSEGFANPRNKPDVKAPPVGAEHPSESSGKSDVELSGAAESAAVDAELEIVIDAWASLGPDLRSAIIEIVRTTAADGRTHDEC